MPGDRPSSDHQSTVRIGSSARVRLVGCDVQPAPRGMWPSGMPASSTSTTYRRGDGTPPSPGQPAGWYVNWSTADPTALTPDSLVTFTSTVPTPAGATAVIDLVLVTV